MKNYIAEIKGFQDMVQLNELSTGQIALWYALMYINNKCAWIEWFKVPNRVLESNTGLSRSGVAKARNSLKQVGILDFKPQGTKATLYKLNTLTMSNSTQARTIADSEQDSTQDGNQDSNQVGVQARTQGSNQARTPLNKLNETKLDETKTITSNSDPPEELPKIIKALEQEFGMLISPSVLQLAEGWLESWGIPDMPLHAIEQAALANKRNARYVDGILRNWRTSGIKTVEQAKAEAADFQRNKKTDKQVQKPLSNRLSSGPVRDFSHLEE